MINQYKVKNVIIDLGGVLVNINPQKTFSAFKRILIPELADSVQWNEIPEEFLALETGRINKEEFISYFSKLCKPEVLRDEIVNALCAMILDFPYERVEIIKSLSEKYQVYLLSNTNPFHIHHFEKEFQNRYYFSLHQLFTKVYYSSEIGYRKPEAHCFHYVLNDAGIKAEETVMIDDMAENCLAAEAIGLMSLKVPENKGLEAVIGQLI
jgi:glucose-1-phosphatase